MSKRRYIVWKPQGKGVYQYRREVWWSGTLKALNYVLARSHEVAFTPVKSKEKFPNATNHPGLRKAAEPEDCDERDDWACEYCRHTYTNGSPLIIRGRDVCKDCARELYG